MYNSMIEAIKEETVQLLFHIDIKQVATTDEAVDEVEETAESADTIAVASGPDENGESVVEAAEGEVEEEDEDTDAKQAIAESAAASGAGESTLPVAGPAPISHAEGKVPVPSVRRAKSSRRRGPTAAPSWHWQERPVPVRFRPQVQDVPRPEREVTHR